MKHVLLLLYFLLIYVACSVDVNINNLDLYEGDYEGVFNCIGQLERDNGDDFKIDIERINSIDYNIIIEDDFFLTAERDGNILVVPVQSIEFLFDLEDVTIDGTISLLDDDNLNFNFFIESDDGDANCVTILFED